MANGHRRSAVTREEFSALQRKMEECMRSLDLQFKRIAQIQAELDHIRMARTEASSKKSAPASH